MIDSESVYLPCRRFFRHANDAVKRGFRFAVAVEQQWVTGSASDRPIVQPRIAVRDTPEGHTRDDAAMFAVDAEQVGVTLGESLLHGIRQSVRVWVQPRLRI